MHKKSIMFRNSAQYRQMLNKSSNDKYKLLKQSIRHAIRVFCNLGGFQIEKVAGIKPRSKHRLVCSGIDLLCLQSALLKLESVHLEAVSQYGHNEPYCRQDLFWAIEALAMCPDIRH